MPIKLRIKLSFTILIFAIAVLGLASISMLHQIRTNNSIKDRIFQVILLQERMNTMKNGTEADTLGE